ncbi:MAG: diaminopimelate epimerase [Chloroflexi bacterium]|nr:diaminopimelate epimerase [Chloroflexota bacterium]
MRFAKMHGAGNDYVVLDARKASDDWASLARQLCDRHYGVGSDGLLVVVSSRVADIRMRMFNPDGSEAEMCGNGIRCFTKYVLERGIVSRGRAPVRVETGAGVLEVAPFWGHDGRVERARVAMGEPRFSARDIPVLLPAGESGLRLDITNLSRDVTVRFRTEELVAGYPLQVDGRTFSVTCVSMGNPHAVAFLEEPVDLVPLERLGPMVEHHPLFPRRVNFHIVNRYDGSHLKARSWERGAGLTLACGTGACAIQAAARLLGLTEETVELQMPGGVLIVSWPGDGPVHLEGPAEEVFEGEWRATVKTGAGPA